MTDHPLTEDICLKLSADYSKELAYAHPEFTVTVMRTAADFQLECDAEWWRIILKRMKILRPVSVDSLVNEFKQVMRSQEES